jgi:hypothetical protein
VKAEFGKSISEGITIAYISIYGKGKLEKYA